jgi:DNA-binding beta-propeller fold protein YncE
MPTTAADGDRRRVTSIVVSVTTIANEVHVTIRVGVSVISTKCRLAITTVRASSTLPRGISIAIRVKVDARRRGEAGSNVAVSARVGRRHVAASSHKITSTCPPVRPGRADKLDPGKFGFGRDSFRMLNRFVLRGTSLALLAIALTSVSVGATEQAPPNTVRMGKIFIPGKPLKAFDISFVDPAAEHYYIADRSNASVDVIDIPTNAVVAQIPGFVGAKASNDVSGPDGVVTTFSGRELWAGDGDSTVKVIDLLANKVVQTISTGGKNRADEMSYDPKENIILVANNADDPPFGSIISVPSRTVLKKIVFADSTNGAEQSQYDPVTGLFFMSIPATNTNPGGEIDVIDPMSMSIVNKFGLVNCGPNGLAIGPGNQMLAGCGNPHRAVILDRTNGAVLADLNNVGGADEVWYNAGDNRYYMAETGFQNLGVIDASTLTTISEVQSGLGAHSVAADLFSNRIFVPVAGPDPACPSGCIAVYSTATLENNGMQR